MALINCPECGKEVSDQAPKCIHCGFPIISSVVNTNMSTVKKEKKPIPKKILFSIVGGVVVVTMIVVFIVTNLTPEAKYKKAEKAFEEAKYEKAMKLYSSIPEYEDAAEKVEIATTMYNYTTGVEAHSKGDWEKAKESLTLCESYEDSKRIIEDCDYQSACEKLEAGNYQEAKDIFESVVNYSEARQKIYECNYNIGLVEENNGNVLEAAKYYGDSSNYSDSTDRINKIAEQLITEGKYAEAVTVFDNLPVNLKSQNKAAKYAEGYVNLASKNLVTAANLFFDAGDYLNSKDLFKTTAYDYAMSEFNKKNYSTAKSWFNKVLGYKESKTNSQVCDLMDAKAQIEDGNLNSAKSALAKLSDDISYGGISVADLKALLEANSEWVKISGKWGSTGGQMRSTQVSRYRDYWWYRDFTTNEYFIDVRCCIKNGKVIVKLNGSIPIYTNYSSISSGLKSSSQSLNIEKELSTPGTIKINDYCTVSISSSKITANYKLRDNGKDVYFTYVYKTDVTYGSKTKDY